MVRRVLDVTTEGETTVFNPLDLDVQLARHAEAVAAAERHGWKTQQAQPGRRPRRLRDQFALLFFALAEKVEPGVVPAHLRSGFREGRL